jgi:hypothetical protein
MRVTAWTGAGHDAGGGEGRVPRRACRCFGVRVDELLGMYLPGRMRHYFAQHEDEVQVQRFTISHLTHVATRFFWSCFCVERYRQFRSA